MLCASLAISLYAKSNAYVREKFLHIFCYKGECVTLLNAEKFLQTTLDNACHPYYLLLTETMTPTIFPALLYFHRSSAVIIAFKNNTPKLNLLCRPYLLIELLIRLRTEVRKLVSQDAGVPSVLPAIAR